MNNIHIIQPTFGIEPMLILAYSKAILTNQNKGFVYISIYSLLLILINSVQFPLHEPYFDLTPIKVTHTKTIDILYISYY